MKFLIALLATGMLTLSVWAAGPVNINTASAEEIAESLNGVTMHEPGVSRLVSVDVGEAVVLAGVQ